MSDQKHTKTAVESSIIDRLDDEIIMHEILKGFPIENLCQFKSVSKEWRDMISDPIFVTFYEKWSDEKPRRLLIVNHEDGEGEGNYKKHFILFSCVDPIDGSLQYRRLYQITIPIDENVHLLPSGRSLLCIQSGTLFFVFNATTKKFMMLPGGTPSEEKSMAAFGYVQSRNKYVLVHLFGTCEILTLSESGELISPWRTIAQKSTFVADDYSSILIVTKFYWMNTDYRRVHPENRVIVCLDIEEESFKAIEHPHYKSYTELNDMHLGELRGCLCLVDSFAAPRVMDVWVLKDPQTSTKEGWIKECRIDLLTLDGFDDDECATMRLVSYDGDRKELIIQDFEREDAALHYYDLKDRKFRKGRDFGTGARSAMFLYKESFNSIKKTT